MWFQLTGDNLDRPCATEGCFVPATFRLEAGGVGSDYCANCKAIIQRRQRGDTMHDYSETQDTLRSLMDKLAQAAGVVSTTNLPPTADPKEVMAQLNYIQAMISDMLALSTEAKQPVLAMLDELPIPPQRVIVHHGSRDVTVIHNVEKFRRYGKKPTR